MSLRQLEEVHLVGWKSMAPLACIRCRVFHSSGLALRLVPDTSDCNGRHHTRGVVIGLVKNRNPVHVSVRCIV